MIKLLASIEHQIGDNLYKFVCPSTLNIDEAKQALFVIMKIVGQLEDNAKAQQAAQPAPEEPKQEEPSPQIAQE